VYGDFVDNGAASTCEFLLTNNWKYTVLLVGHVAFHITNFWRTEEPLLFVELLPEVGVIVCCWEVSRTFQERELAVSEPFMRAEMFNKMALLQKQKNTEDPQAPCLDDIGLDREIVGIEHGAQELLDLAPIAEVFLDRGKRDERAVGLGVRTKRPQARSFRNPVIKILDDAAFVSLRQLHPGHSVCHAIMGNPEPQMDWGLRRARV
jgi:hypothetical protein